MVYGPTSGLGLGLGHGQAVENGEGQDSDTRVRQNLVWSVLNLKSGPFIEINLIGMKHFQIIKVK